MGLAAAYQSAIFQHNIATLKIVYNIKKSLYYLGTYKLCLGI